MLLFFLLLPVLATAQTFAGIGIGNHYAANAFIGYSYKDKPEISIGYFVSAFTSEMPAISYMKAGYTIGMFTMAAGVSNFSYSDNLKIPGKSGRHVLYSLDCSHTMHTGKLYSNVTYTGNLLYISAGIRAYIK